MSRPSTISSAVPCQPEITPLLVVRGKSEKLPVCTSSCPGLAARLASASAASSACFSWVCTTLASAPSRVVASVTVSRSLGTSTLALADRLTTPDGGGSSEAPAPEATSEQTRTSEANLFIGDLFFV